MIKKYYEFVFENLNRSKSIVKSKMDDYEKIKTFLNSHNAMGYMGKFTELLFNGIPYNEIMNLYEQLTDLKKKNIKINIDGYEKYENILDVISRKLIFYKFKNIFNQFPKEQKEMFNEDKDENTILLISKLYDVDYKPFITKISRYKDYYELISSIERFLNGKVKSYSREDIKNLLNDNLKLVFENKDILIVKTLTHDSILEIGSDTSWCIVRSKRTFEDYIKNGQTQYVLFDYTKDIYDTDFKIGFTLSSENAIIYAHDILDKSVKQYVADILENNNINLSSINILPKIDPNIINKQTKLNEIERIISSFSMSNEVFEKILESLCFKLERNLRSNSSIYNTKLVIKMLFRKLASGNTDPENYGVITEDVFDKYLNIMGDVYNHIKHMLIDDYILSSTEPPSNIFHNINMLLKNYKRWDYKLISGERYLSIIESDNRCAEPILYFASKSPKTNENQLVVEYCKFIKGESVDIDRIKSLISKIENQKNRDTDKYQLYNYFKIKYNFDINDWHNQKKENIIPSKIIINNSINPVLHSDMIKKLENCNVTIIFNKDKFLDDVNYRYKTFYNSISKKTSATKGYFGNKDNLLDIILKPIMSYFGKGKSRLIGYTDLAKFPIKYKINIDNTVGHYYNDMKLKMTLDIIIE